MPTLNGRQYTGLGGINLRESNGLIRFETPLITPTVTTGERVLYVNSSNELIYSNGSGTVVVGAAGGAGSTPTWETIWNADNTFTLTADATWTIAGNRNTATNVVTMTNVAGASGAILSFTNSTTSNNDVLGTGSTWAVTGAGNATFVGLTLTGTTITSTTGAKAWTLLDNSATALVIGASGATAILTVDTSDAAPLVKFGNGISLTDGNATFISTSNTVTNVLVTNNTITTFGANASSAGAVCIRSTSLTTGSLLQLQLSDTALAGGFYLTCRESVGGTNDFTIGENGVIAITGTASADSVLVTSGNFTMSDGVVAVTSTGTADVLTVTADSLLSNNLAIFKGSGTFTGTGSSAFVAVTPTGLTTGTALSVVAAAATTSVAVVDIAAAALTSGSALRITPGSATITTGGKSIEIEHGSAVAGNGVTVTTTGAYSGTGLVLLTAGAATTGILLSLVSTTGMTSGSLLRGTTSTAGAVATNGIFSMRATGNYTSTSNAGLLDVSATATTAGTVVNIKGDALTTGVALNVSGTGVYSGAGFITVTQSGMTTGVGMLMTYAGLTTGSGLSITTAALTTGQSILVTDSSSDTGAHAAIFAKVTNTAATAAAPLKTSNVAVNNSKFTKILVSTDGTKTFTLWLSQDATSPNTVLSGVVGDICVNGPSGRSFYCTGTTNWTASNA